MTNLTIYNSNGQKYTADGVQSASDSRIESFFFAGVKLAVTGGSRPEVIAFFRAKERAGGRSEQFYAVYQAAQQRNCISNFVRELRTRVEDEWGLVIDENANDMDVFRELDNPSNNMPGSDFEHEVIDELLRQHQNIEFGVGNVSQAVTMLAKQFISGDAKSFAISNEGRTDVLSNYALVVSPGGYSGLTPLGNTAQQMQHARSSKKEQLVQQRIKDIKSNVADIKQNSNLSDSEIRRKITQQVPLLKTSQSTSSTASSNYSNTSTYSASSGSSNSGPDVGDILSKALPIAIPVAFIIAALVVTVVFVLPGLGIDVLAGGDSGPLSNEAISADYNDSQQLIVVRGSDLGGKADSKSVSLNVTQGDKEIDSAKAPVENSSFTETLGGEIELQGGEYTVHVSVAGDTVEKNVSVPESETTVTSTTTITATPTSSPTPTPASNSTPTSSPTPTPASNSTPTSESIDMPTTQTNSLVQYARVI